MKCNISVDLGGTRIKIGIVQQGKLLCHTLTDAFSDKGLLLRLPVIEEVISQLLAEQNLSLKEVGGIGISIPGIVDSQRMKLLSVNQKFNDAVDFDFPAWARLKWDLPLIMENDARCALAGEWKFGAGRGFENLVMVTFGTGIGGATIMEGKLLRGAHFQAGCLGGHFTIDYRGDTCNCGNIGCVESVASSWRLPEKALNHALSEKSKLTKSDSIDYKLVFEYYKAGDILARELVHDSLEAWSAGIISLIHAYDPELVVLGGGIMKSHEIILPFVREKVERHAWTPWGKVQVVCAENPDWGALQGLDYLLNEKYSGN